MSHKNKYIATPKNSPRQNRLLDLYLPTNSPGKKIDRNKMNFKETVRYFKAKKEKELENDAIVSKNTETLVNSVDPNSKEIVDDKS